MKEKKKTRGPKPEVLKLETPVDWKDAMKHALGKPKPKGGWPKDEKAPPKK